MAFYSKNKRSQVQPRQTEEATGPATRIISLMQKAGPGRTTLTVRGGLLGSLAASIGLERLS